jgi:integrase
MPKDVSNPSRHEAARLLWACRNQKWHYLRLFVLIALYAGARHEAILEPTWDRVDFDPGRVDFRVPGRIETNKRRPNAPVSRRLLRFLWWAKQETNSNYVIVHRGGPLKSVEGAFRQARKRAKILNAPPHTLKHTAITWMLQKGVSVWEVFGLTATRVETICSVYGKHIPDALADAANRTHKAPVSKTFSALTA